ncbi:MAG: CAP domain-containing protein [bacterium]
MNLPQTLKDYFLPHPEGDRRAKLAHHGALGTYIGLLASLALFLNFFPKIAPGVLSFTSFITPDQIVGLTNQKRQELGLSTLTYDARLEAAAQAKGENMLANDYWAHTSPLGKTPWQFILSQGYDYIYAGENLAKDFAYAEEAQSAWMASPTHKANIVNPNYKNIGVAVVKGDLNGEEAVLVVQMFGSESTLPVLAKGQASGNSGLAPEGQVAGTGLESGPLAVPKINKFAVGKDVSAIILGVVMALLLLDTWYLKRKKILRLSGHNLAHLLIIGVALAGILGSSAGSIL